jgi:hypothetical protein
MTSKTLSLTILCALALGNPSYSLAQDARGAMAEAMSEAMVRMMDAMGLFGAGSLSRWDRGPAVSGLTPPFGTMMGWPGVSPWGMPMQDPSKALGFGADMMKPWSQGSARGDGRDGGRALDGVWEGSGGDLLIVQGGRYRIYAPQDQHVDGWLQQQANRIALYNAQRGQSQVFEYAAQDGRLALRDNGGQVFLYRRFGGAPEAPVSAPPAAEPEPPATSTPPKTSSAR